MGYLKKIQGWKRKKKYVEGVIKRAQKPQLHKPNSKKNPTTQNDLRWGILNKIVQRKLEQVFLKPGLHNAPLNTDVSELTVYLIFLV